MGRWGLALFFAGCGMGAALRTDCPPHFLKRADRCYLASGYLRPRAHGFQKTILSSKDGLSPKLIDLGRHLFFDPILSADQSISCSSCHDPRFAMADGLAVSRDVHGFTSRSTPPLWNLAFAPIFFWDGRSNSLESQLEGPLFSEMGNSKENLLKTLNASLKYRAYFRNAFETPHIEWPQVQAAIADFERTLVSLNSPYDRYIAGDVHALNAEQIAGLAVFRSFTARCNECHEPPLFTNFQFAELGVPEETGILRNRSPIRIPSLRNIALTAPYMHSGSLKSLQKVVDFYDGGGGRGRLPFDDVAIHWHIRPMGLSILERRRLLSFLESLTDLSALPEIPLDLPETEALG